MYEALLFIVDLLNDKKQYYYLNLCGYEGTEFYLKV